MPIDVDELVGACKILARTEDLQKCVWESAKGSACAGLGAFVGGVVGGRVGIVAGGLLGGLVGSSMSQTFKPVWRVIQDMNEKDRNDLFNHMQKVLNNLDITDAAVLMAIVTDQNSSERQDILKALQQYFS